MNVTIGQREPLRASRRRWPRCIGIAMSIVMPVFASAEVAMRIQRDIVFDNNSPLASSSVLTQRVMAPLLRERIRTGAQASGIAISEQSIDLAKERFSVYVPEGVKPAAGYGLLVFISPWDKADIPARWLPALARHKLVVVTAANAGNDQNVIERRMPLALSAYENMRKRYPIDPARIYAGGLSGGGRVAMRLALAFPDVFHGALLNAGSDPVGTLDVPLPDAALFREFEQRSRLVYTTGSDDSAVMRTDMRSRDSLHDLCFSDVTTLTMRGRGHEPTDPATLERALDALDAPRTEELEMGACRISRDAEIAKDLAAINARMDARNLRDAATQLQAIDEHFGGLAMPGSLDLARRLADRSDAVSASKP